MVNAGSLDAALQSVFSRHLHLVRLAMKLPCVHRLVLLLIVGALSACASRPSPGPNTAPRDIASTPARVAATTAHPLATQAALQMLAEGGSAIDALVAAQAVLGLVEPQSSGFGGGALLLVWDARAQRLRSYDGLSAAPARVTASLRTDVDGKLLPAEDVARGGRSVGVPGMPALLEMVHLQHGKLPWARLFQPAIALAQEGFPLAPYLHGILSQDPGAKLHPALRDTHFGADGLVKPAGTLLRHPAYARTLQAMAAQGATRYLAQEGAAKWAAAAQAGKHASLMTAQDITAYRAQEREPLCARVVTWRICMAGPPSFGGVAVLQMLQMVHARAPQPFDLSTPGFWQVFVEAGRLAGADRRHWVGDPGFVPVPSEALIAAPYMAERAKLINPMQALPKVEHGRPAQATSALLNDESNPTSATSQLAIVDAQGMVVSATTTNNLNFGSRLVADGVVLNNALTNFSAAPGMGGRLANQMEAGKRPVTSMAPLIVFDEAGLPLLAGGSAGGGQIVDYIAQSLIEMLWLGRTPAQALASGHVTTALAPTIQLEKGTAREALAEPLAALGQKVVKEPTVSGQGYLRRQGAGWLGAADPRRDGVALGW
jgi:gamma-glutamyltranspeptidase / glutathione hydrolase